MSSFEVDAAMPSPLKSRTTLLLVGLPGASVLADMRVEDEFNFCPRLFPPPIAA